MIFKQNIQILAAEEPRGIKADGDEEELDDEELMRQSMGADAETQDHADAVENTWKLIHEKADILLAHSTVPGTYLTYMLAVKMAWVVTGEFMVIKQKFLLRSLHS